MREYRLLRVGEDWARVVDKYDFEEDVLKDIAWHRAEYPNEEYRAEQREVGEWGPVDA